MSASSTTPPADKLDHLLASQPVSARDHFAGRVRARLHEDPAGDAAEFWVEHLLAETEVFAPDDLADRVRRRIFAGEGVAPKEKSVSYWRSLLPFAAAAGLLFGVLSLTTIQSEPPLQVAAVADALPSSFNRATASVDNLARATDLSASMHTSSAARHHPAAAAVGYDDLAKVLALASGLGLEARVLLERPDIHSWLALAE
ncbi:MAG: hypothetical protein JJT96_01575 [Opitutales bacterium]|nr:hypothetical protein [Opitutales bacterium]